MFNIALFQTGNAIYMHVQMFCVLFTRIGYLWEARLCYTVNLIKENDTAL